MDLITFLICVFCLVDDFLKGKRPRQRGPQPTLSDSEVLTMEIVGEFLVIDADRSIYATFAGITVIGFRPCDGFIVRLLCARLLNLWRVKQQLWSRLIRQIEHDSMIAITDSLPIPVSRFARAYRCR